MGEMLRPPPERARWNPPSIAQALIDSDPPMVAWPQKVRCGVPHPLLRLPAKADDEHPVAAYIQPPRARARAFSAPPSWPPVGAAIPVSRTSRRRRRVRLPIRNALRHVFHIVSTGEPALAVQAGNLRRGLRHRPAGTWGLRFPRKQGTGLQQVIHSLSRRLAAMLPG